MGKHKYIDNPEKLMDLFLSYERYIKTNPKLKNNFAGKDAIEVHFELERPLTMEGFETYTFRQGFNADLGDYFSNKDNRYADYAAICSRIKKEIRADQIEGGMTGIYNPSITQRLNGLVEKTDNKNENTEIKKKYKLTMNL